MKKNSILIITLSIFFACSSTKRTSNNTSAFKNMIATMQVDKPIPGVCDNSMVIAILPLPGNGQVSAKAPHSDEEITKMLNAEVSFLKDNPDYNDEGMVGLIVNCKGKMVRCQIDNKTKSPELDQQIVDVFSKMIEWEAGTLNGRPVDTSVLYSFKIKKGVISL